MKSGMVLLFHNDNLKNFLNFGQTYKENPISTKLFSIKLLISQKNHLFEMIQQSGYNVSQYELIEGDSFTKIEFSGSSYSFAVKEPSSRSSYNFRIDYSPGYDKFLDYQFSSDWETVLILFREWLSYLKREVSAEDKWQRLRVASKGANLQIGDQERKFSAQEYDELVLRLDGLNEQIRQQFSLDEAKTKFLQQSIEQLKDSAKTLSMKDWGIFFTGMVVELIMQLTLSQDQGKLLWDIAKQAFSGFFLQ